jgi:hypothetical protein
MRINTEKLDCMNYMVDNGSEHYYLCCGVEDLEWFSNTHDVDLIELMTALLNKGYFVIPDGITQIAMI